MALPLARVSGRVPPFLIVAASTVAGLRIWCDLDRAEGVADLSTVNCFRVHEFAVLSDGREVVLLADRGWKGVPVSWLTVENVEHHVYNVLLPDWADVDHPLPPELAKVEAVGGAQDWELLSDRLLAFGVTTTPQLLCTVPRQLDLSARLLAHVKESP